MATTTETDNSLRKSSDVYSMTDDALASRYKFEKEVRYGPRLTRRQPVG